MDADGTCVSKNLGETVRIQIEKSGYERSEERDYMGLGKSNAHQPRLFPEEMKLDSKGGQRIQFVPDVPESLR